MGRIRDARIEREANRRRNELTERVLARKEQGATADTMGAQARMMDARSNRLLATQDLQKAREGNRTTLQAQRLRNEGGVAEQLLRNEGAITTTGMELAGKDRQLEATHRYGMEQLGQQNIFNKEADNRKLTGELLLRGADAPAGSLNRLYNTRGEFDPDISNITVPQEPRARYGFQKLTGGVDSEGRLLPDQLLRTNPSTGQVEYAEPEMNLPGVAGGSPRQFTEQDVMFAENVLGRDFDPYSATPMQRAYLKRLRDTNRPLFDHIRSGYGM
jgi:hypothetical protein